MLSAFLKSAFVFLLIPIFTLAIEPSNPASLCDRYLGEEEKSACVLKTSKTDLDWYAASACGLQQEDKNFDACLSEIKDSTFNPEALELCAKDPASSDELRFACLRKIKGRDYTRATLKKCGGHVSTELVVQCLAQDPLPRLPASAPKSKGFQTLEIRR